MRTHRLASICAVLVIALQASSSFANGTSRNDLLAAIDTGNVDLVSEQLTKIQGMSHPQDVLPTIGELWDGPKAGRSDESQRIVRQDIVRVQLAAILLQARANGHIKVEIAPLHEYLRKMVESFDRQVAIRAISSLSQLDNPSDATQLAAVARQSDARFRAAVVALSRMCNPQATRVLEQLKKDLPKDADYIASVVGRSEAFKSDVGWCTKQRP